MSQLTSHILDTSIGKPAKDVAVLLEYFHAGSWRKISEAISNSEGRIVNFIDEEKVLEMGLYRLIFDTASYFSRLNMKTFFPKVTIEFEITDGSHYHVPLLLSPYGYSTYRGS